MRLENHTARVYRVLWSLSDVAGGELRKPAPPPAPPPEKRPGAVRSLPENVRISGPVAARRLGAADGGRFMTATWADVDRAVSGRPGRGPRNGPGLERRRPRAVTPLVQRWAFPTTRFRASSVACGGVGASEHQVLRPAYDPDRQDLLVDDLSTRRRFGDAADGRAFIRDLHALHARPHRRTGDLRAPRPGRRAGRSPTGARSCCEAGSCSALPAVRRCTVRFTNGFEGSPLAGR